MQDFAFYSSCILAQMFCNTEGLIPSGMQEMTATAILGVVVVYTIVRINNTLGKISDSLDKHSKAIWRVNKNVRSIKHKVIPDSESDDDDDED